jgi:murein DD-endopeptidase / murein LD-carboxypeptidase
MTNYDRRKQACNLNTGHATYRGFPALLCTFLGKTFYIRITVMDLKPKHVLIAAMLLLNCSASVFAQKKGKSQRTEAGPRFIDDIEINPGGAATASTRIAKQAQTQAVYAVSNSENDIEKAGAIQLKFALLLDTEVESIRNTKLFSLIDEWLGVHYRLGGTDKRGIDCSAFMQVLSMGALGITLPRTAREQFNFSNSIETSELKEGDLVFFSTGGVISHVGFYLQNNKFVHASTSEGVMVSDLSDNYWARKFSGAGRISATATAQSTLKP